MKRYRYILFDWDGTIGKTLNIWSDALQATLSKKGFSYNEAAIGANYELFRTQFKHLGNETLDDIVEEALVISNSQIPSVILYDARCRYLLRFL